MVTTLNSKDTWTNEQGVERTETRKRTKSVMNAAGDLLVTTTRIIEALGHTLEVILQENERDATERFRLIFDGKTLPDSVPFLDGISSVDHTQWGGTRNAMDFHLPWVRVHLGGDAEDYPGLGKWMDAVFPEWKDTVKLEQQSCVDKLKEYVDKRLQAGETPELFAKTARITARPGKVGEEIITKMKDGHTETRNTVANKGDMVATNPSGEQYIIDAKTFAKKYEIDPANPKQYRPKGGAQEFIPVEGEFCLVAPWGEVVKIQKDGGVLNVTARETGDIYGIQRKEFEDTYDRCDAQGTILPRNSMRRALKKAEPSKKRKFLRMPLKRRGNAQGE